MVSFVKHYYDSKTTLIVSKDVDAYGNLPQSVTLHTNLGDLKIEIFAEAVPRAAEVRESSLFNLAVLVLSIHIGSSLN